MLGQRNLRKATLIPPRSEAHISAGAVGPGRHQVSRPDLYGEEEAGVLPKRANGGEVQRELMGSMMKEGEQGASDAIRFRRKWGWWMALVATAAAAGVVLVLLVWPRPAVRWAQVLEAVGERDTVYGRGHVYLPDGTEWDYVLWASIEGPGRCVQKGIVRPANQRAALLEGIPAHLPPLCAAMDPCGEGGIVARLAAAGRAGRAEREEWGGRSVLAAEVKTAEVMGGTTKGAPDWCRLLVDPDAKLLLGVELFAAEGEDRVLWGGCEYHYDLPLPPGFEEAPG